MKLNLDSKRNSKEKEEEEKENQIETFSLGGNCKEEKQKKDELKEKNQEAEIIKPSPLIETRDPEKNVKELGFNKWNIRAK